MRSTRQLIVTKHLLFSNINERCKQDKEISTVRENTKQRKLQRTRTNKFLSKAIRNRQIKKEVVKMSMEKFK